MDNIISLEYFVLKKCLQAIEDIRIVLKEAEEKLTPEEFEQFCKDAEPEILRMNQIVIELKGLSNV